MHILNKLNIVVFCICTSITILSGQVKIGVDVYSRYISRGLDYGNAPSLQPSLAYTTGGFSFGAWGAFSLSSSDDSKLFNSVVVPIASASNTFSETDLWARMTFATEAGIFCACITDYFYPSRNLKFFNYKDGGSHIVEAGLEYTGQNSFPVTIAVYNNFLNDIDKSIYLLASFPIEIDSVYSVRIFAAGTPSKSVWYSAKKGNLTNVGLTVSKKIVITESFSLPVSASYIINPEIEQSYLIFGISL